MAIPGNSSLPQIAYWSGDPTNVPLAELNIAPYTMVIDLAAGVIRQKTSTTDNSTFVTVATTTGAQTPSSIAATGSITTSTSTGGMGFATGAGGAVVQASSITTGVVLSKPCGKITTVASTLAAAASIVFTVTNTLVAATDVPIAVVGTYAGGGTPIVAVKNVVSGAYDIVLFNAHASAALDAAVIINVAIHRAVIS